jgi:hypothetical protein
MIVTSFKLEKVNHGLGLGNQEKDEFFIQLMVTIKGLGVILVFMTLFIVAFCGL